MMKKEQGITLIALVVTIVVLLILAGTSIAMLTGENGIITRASEAKENTRGGEVKERVEIAAIENETIDGTENKKNKQDMIDELYEDGKLTSKEVDTLETTDIITIGDIEIDFGILDGNKQTGGDIETGESGKKYEEDTTVIIGDEEVSIPGGATISKVPGEYEDVEEGVVIYIVPEGETPDWEADEDGDGILDVQEKYDQFVWVPVPNPVLDLSGNTTALSSEENIKAEVQKEIESGRYPMAIKKNETDYFGVLYQFDEENGQVKIQPLIEDVNGFKWSPLSDLEDREPAYLADSLNADGSSYNNTDPKITESLLQEEYNIMVEKVSKQKGFWVGRYETSNMTTDNTKDTSNKIEIIRGTTNGINNVDWYRMYAQQKSYRNLTEISSTRTSSMIWGSQWDQIIIWMRNVKNEAKNSYYVINSLTMGNFGTSDDPDSSATSPSPTGNSDKYKVKNVYDLAGNVFDGTLESDSTYYRVYRRKLF